MDFVDLNTLRTVDALRDYRGKLTARLTEIEGEFEGLPLPEALQAEWDQIGDVIAEIDTRVTEIEARKDYLRQVAAADVAGRRTERAATALARTPAKSRLPEDLWDVDAYRMTARSREDYRGLLVDGTRKIVERASFPHPNADPDRNRAYVLGLLEAHREDSFGEELAEIIATTSHPLYGPAFGKAVVGLPLDGPEIRALTLGSGAGGGYAVPWELDPTIVLTSDGAINPLREISRIERITGKGWQGVTSAGATVTRGGETDEAPDTTFTLAQPQLDTIEVKAFVKFSIKLESAWGALRTEIARILQDAKDAEEAQAFVNGNGTGTNPGGIVGTMPGASIINTVGAGALAVEDVYNVKNAVPPRWRGRGRYLAEGAIYDRIRQLDTGGGANLWVQLADPNPPTLAGKPAHEISTMDNTIAAGKKILLFGDFSQFLIVDRIGMTVELVPHVFGTNRRPTGERGIFAIWSNNSMILVPEAFRLLNVA
jgi:HK97 family phage major capsid protein